MPPPHFHYAAAYALGVPRISLLHAANAGNYARDSIGIPETAQPGRELLRLAHLDHESEM
jgi:hypothetical protein